jgi:nicotinate-nucleotide--dimethylbenzimidazole phosphoribosyltransferase
VVVDAGVASAAPVPQGVLNHRVRAGTRNMCREPAMTVSEAEAALDCGVAVAQQAVRAGANVVGLGEMGIGNTTAAAALAAAWVPARPARVTGRGTGVDDAGLRRKRLAVARSLRLHRPAGRTPIEVLASLGGLEIALLAGVTMGAAACRVPVVVDGFIASVAALSAVKLAPICAGYLIAAHRSVEPGHRYVLDALGLKPLLDLQLRLGEGTGAALAMPLLRVAAAIVDEMASFASAGVSRANTE